MLSFSKYGGDRIISMLCYDHVPSQGLVQSKTRRLRIMWKCVCTWTKIWWKTGSETSHFSPSYLLPDPVSGDDEHLT